MYLLKDDDRGIWRPSVNVSTGSALQGAERRPLRMLSRAAALILQTQTRNVQTSQESKKAIGISNTKLLIASNSVSMWTAIPQVERKVSPIAPVVLNLHADI